MPRREALDLVETMKRVWEVAEDSTLYIDSDGKGLQKNLSLSSCGDYITWTLSQMDRRDPYSFLISPLRHYSASSNKELCETYRFRCGLSRVGTDQRSSASWLLPLQAWDRIRSATMAANTSQVPHPRSEYGKSISDINHRRA